MCKGYYILFVFIILFGCESEPTGIDQVASDTDLPLLAPPKGESQLDGLCECDLNNRRDYLVDVVAMNCDSHEVFNREKVDTMLENCIKKVNEEVNAELEKLCNEIDSICGVGKYYAPLQAGVWNEYRQRVQYLSRLSNAMNYMIISYLIQREKKRLIDVSDYYDNLIGGLASKLRSIHATYDDVYNSQRNDVNSCVAAAEQYGKSIGIDCLEFNVTYVDHNE